MLTKVESTSPPVVESLDDAFKKFEEVCKKYEAVGKGIMGSQEAQKQNFKSAVEHWEQSSQLGHAKSHFNLALCYEMGKGVKKDLKEVQSSLFTKYIILLYYFVVQKQFSNFQNLSDKH